jgi:hypothetical protein
MNRENAFNALMEVWNIHRAGGSVSTIADWCRLTNRGAQMPIAGIDAKRRLPKSYQRRDSERRRESEISDAAASAATSVSAQSLSLSSPIEAHRGLRRLSAPTGDDTLSPPLSPAITFSPHGNVGGALLGEHAMRHTALSTVDGSMPLPIVGAADPLDGMTSARTSISVSAELPSRHVSQPVNGAPAAAMTAANKSALSTPVAARRELPTSNGNVLDTHQVIASAPLHASLLAQSAPPVIPAALVEPQVVQSTPALIVPATQTTPAPTSATTATTASQAVSTNVAAPTQAESSTTATSAVQSVPPAPAPATAAAPSELSVPMPPEQGTCAHSPDTAPTLLEQVRAVCAYMRATLDR